MIFVLLMNCKKTQSLVSEFYWLFLSLIHLSILNLDIKVSQVHENAISFWMLLFCWNILSPCTLCLDKIYSTAPCFLKDGVCPWHWALMTSVSFSHRLIFKFCRLNYLLSLSCKSSMYSVYVFYCYHFLPSVNNNLGENLLKKWASHVLFIFRLNWGNFVNELS